jgi:hypothetical protein
MDGAIRALTVKKLVINTFSFHNAASEAETGSGVDRSIAIS